MKINKDQVTLPIHDGNKQYYRLLKLNIVNHLNLYKSQLIYQYYSSDGLYLFLNVLESESSEIIIILIKPYLIQIKYSVISHVLNILPK